jgi:hypothetical protein
MDLKVESDLIMVNQPKMSEEEYAAFLKKTGYVDPIAIAFEEERKKQVELNIRLAAAAVEDRQALEYWKARCLECERITREAEEDRLDARERERKIARQVPAPKKAAASKKKPAATKSRAEPVRPKMQLDRGTDDRGLASKFASGAKSFLNNKGMKSPDQW